MSNDKLNQFNSNLLIPGLRVCDEGPTKVLYWAWGLFLYFSALV